MPDEMKKALADLAELANKVGEKVGLVGISTLTAQAEGMVAGYDLAKEQRKNGEG